MAQKPITKDYQDGLLEGLKIVSIYGGKMTELEMETEKQGILSREVIAPSETELSKMEIASKAAQVRVLNKELREADELIRNINKGIDNLPLSIKKLSESLSVLNN